MRWSVSTGVLRRGQSLFGRCVEVDMVAAKSAG